MCLQAVSRVDFPTCRSPHPLRTWYRQNGCFKLLQLRDTKSLHTIYIYIQLEQYSVYIYTYKCVCDIIVIYVSYIFIYIYFILSPNIGEWFNFFGHFFHVFFSVPKKLGTRFLCRFCWVPPASPWHSLRPELEGDCYTSIAFIVIPYDLDGSEVRE